jgi:hypothetical protein
MSTGCVIRENATMRIRVCKPGEAMKPVRVLVEKNGSPLRGPVTYPAGYLPPSPGEYWDEKHVVASGRLGAGDDTWDEVILEIKEAGNADQP